MAFNRTFPGFLKADEPFTTGGKALGYTALDFWCYQFSNVWDIYEEVAEFLVSKALRIKIPYNKNGWTLWDINYKGKRIEVKSSAKYHPWQEEGKLTKNNVFGIQKSVPQDDATQTEAIRHNDIYVFCLGIGENQNDAFPLETDHWEFYVVPTSTINRECGDNKTISIKRIKEITHKENGIPFSELKSAIDAIISD